MSVLKSFTVIELAGIGPGPMAGMMLADMGARVIVIEKPDTASDARRHPISLRGKESVVMDLKHRESPEILLSMLEQADVLIDPFRPGACERIGIGPEQSLKRNPGLVYGRVTGWGQEGPLASAPGHDIGYISITGALHAIGERGGNPQVPLNMVADMGGGGMLLLSGILAALLERTRSGKGQIVDAAMVDGTLLQLLTVHEMIAMGNWNTQERGINMLDSGAHYYRVYECSDGKFVSVGAIEEKFYRCLLEKLGIRESEFPDRGKQENWPDCTSRLSEIFKTRTRAQWCQILEGSDACVAPVLSMDEAPHHNANAARNTHVSLDGILQPAPAPRFSRTPSKASEGRHATGSDTRSVLRSMGIDITDIKRLEQSGAITAT